MSYSRADEEEQELGSFVGVLRADEELVCLSLYEEQVSRCPVSALALRLRCACAVISLACLSTKPSLFMFIYEYEGLCFVCPKDPCPALALKE